MSKSMERLIVAAPGHLESKPAQRDRAHPYCTLQYLDPEDLEQTMCDALSDEEKRLQARTDAETFQLHVQFLRAHGLPRGEVTTLYAGRVFSSGVERHSSHAN